MYRVPLGETNEIAGLLDQAALARPEIVRWIDPETGRSMRFAMAGRVTCDDLDSIRVETRSLYSGGPAELTTKLEIWLPDDKVEVSHIDSEEGVLHRYEVKTIAEQIALRNQGRRAYASTKAGVGYLQFVRYAMQSFEERNDTEMQADQSRTEAILWSPLAEIAIQVDRKTGEVHQGIMRTGIDAITSIRFKSRHSSQVFPARHPKEIRIYYLPDDDSVTLPFMLRDIQVNTGTPGSIAVIDGVRELQELPQSDFDWRVFTRSVLDVVGRKIIKADSSLATPLSGDRLNPTVDSGVSTSSSLSPEDPTRYAPTPFVGNYQSWLYAVGAALISVGTLL